MNSYGIDMISSGGLTSVNIPQLEDLQKTMSEVSIIFDNGFNNFKNVINELINNNLIQGQSAESLRTSVQRIDVPREKLNRTKATLDNALGFTKERTIATDKNYSERLAELSYLDPTKYAGE